MGNSNNQTYNAENYSVLKPIKWEKQHWLSNTQLVRNTETNLKGQLHCIPIENLQTQIPVYQFRKDNPQYLVTVHSVEEGRQQILCAGGDFVKVVTQRIPFRLSDLGNVGYAEGLYILECIFKGAKLIDERYLSSCKGPKLEQCSQYVHYTEDMVCFTESGQAKLWVSQNLASNHPTQIPFKNFQTPKQENILQTFNIEKKIVFQLFNLIQSRMSGNKFLNYLQVKRQQEQQLIDFQNSIDFILRIRALEDGENQSIRNIILPSMLVKSMPTNSQYESYTNRSQMNDGSVSNQARLIDQGNTLNQGINRNKLGEGIGRMENSGTSTSSMQDMSKFALPPRPPRKNSKSGSKDKTSRNASPSRPLAKPNISQPNPTTTISPNSYQPQPVHHAPQQSTTHQVNNIRPVVSPVVNTRSLPNMVKKQSLTHPRSPFQQITQPTPGISVNGIQQIPSFQPIQQPISPKYIQKIPQFVPIQSSHQDMNPPQLQKKYSNNQNININTSTTTTNTVNPQPTYHPIQLAINQKLGSVPTSTHTSPPHSNIKPIITFNTNPNKQPYWTANLPTNTEPNQTKPIPKQTTPITSTTPTTAINTTSNTTMNTNTNSISTTTTTLTKQQSNSSTNDIMTNNPTTTTVGQLHQKYNNKYLSNTNNIDSTNNTNNPNKTTPTNIQYQPYKYNQYQQPQVLPRNNDSVPIHKINITFNNSTVPTYTPRTTANTYQQSNQYQYIQPPSSNQYYTSTTTPIIDAYYPTHPTQPQPKFTPINTNNQIKPYPTTSNTPNNNPYTINTNTNTNSNSHTRIVNRSVQKISLKASRNNIDMSPKRQAHQKLPAQDKKTIDQRVHNLLNRQLLADSLLPTTTANQSQTSIPSKNTIENKSNNTTNNNNNNIINNSELGAIRTTHSEIQPSIEQI